MSRGASKCLNVAEMFGSRGGVRESTGRLAVGSAVRSAMKPPPPKHTRMLEVKAPGSVFGRRHEMIASLATPSSKETPAATSTTQKQMSVAAVGVKRRSSVRKVETTNASATSTLFGASVAKRKISTKECDEEYEQAIFQDDCCYCWSFECPAMRGQSTAFEWFGAACTWNTTAAATTKVETRMEASAPREDSKGSGGDKDEVGDGDSMSTVLCSNQGELDAAASASEGEGEATSKSAAMNGRCRY